MKTKNKYAKPQRCILCNKIYGWSGIWLSPQDKRRITLRHKENKSGDDLGSGIVDASLTSLHTKLCLKCEMRSGKQK